MIVYLVLRAVALDRTDYPPPPVSEERKSGYHPRHLQLRAELQ